MKANFMKKMISILCASVMTTSCAVGSVGAIKASTVDLNTDREGRVLGLSMDIQQTIQNIDKVIGRIQRAVEKKVELKIDASEVLEALESIKESLMNTEDFKLCHDEIIKRVESDLKSINEHIEHMMEIEIDNLAYYALSRSDALKIRLTDLTKGLQFSHNLDDKRFDLHMAGLFIKKVNDPAEKSRLKQCYDKAQNYYNDIVSTVTFATKSSRAKAQRFFDLADQAINELNKARDAQNNIHLPVSSEPNNMNEVPDPIAGEKENLNRIKEENERIKRELAKKQAEERAKKKEKLKQEEHNLEEELKKLNEKAKSLRNIKAIHDGWYTSEELPVIERLIEIQYRLQEVRSDLLDMDMPEIFVNMNKEFENKDEEKALVRKKFEINRKHVNLRNELSNIVFLREEGMDVDSTQIESDINAAEKAMNEINNKIKKEIERKNKVHRELGAFNFNLGK